MQSIAPLWLNKVADSQLFWVGIEISIAYFGFNLRSNSVHQWENPILSVWI